MLPGMTDATEPPTGPWDELLTRLKDQLKWIDIAFGQPADLVRRLPVLEWRRLRTWVRGAEELASTLIRALAAGMGEQPCGPRRPSAVVSERSAPDTDHSDSERWTGVVFRTTRSDRSAAPAPTTGFAEPFDSSAFSDPGIFTDEPRRPDAFRDARRLALRFEAAIRVAENPERYARRLARRTARPPPDRAQPSVAPPDPAMEDSAQAPRTTLVEPQRWRGSW